MLQAGGMIQGLADIREEDDLAVRGGETAIQSLGFAASGRNKQSYTPVFEFADNLFGGIGRAIRDYDDAHQCARVSSPGRVSSFRRIILSPLWTATITETEVVKDRSFATGGRQRLMRRASSSG
jgi:hypothetical protein